MQWTRLDWSDEIARAMVEHLGVDLQYVADEVRNGDALAYECVSENGRAFVLLRVEPDELVLIAAQKTEGRNILNEAFSDLDRFAADNGLCRIRVHVTKEATGRLYKRFGFEKTAIVMHREVGYHGKP